MKRHAPATERNRAPILSVLSSVLPPRGVVLEVASGTGQHAVHFAIHFRDLTWQPSDADEGARESIAAHRDEAQLPNLRAPLALDVTREGWARELSADAIVCINMIHIAPWEATLGLLHGAAHLLAEGAPLYLYGPFRFGGRFTAPSNQDFDASLRERNERWGVRDLDEVTRAAETAGLHREAVIDMPANNHSVVFRRS